MVGAYLIPPDDLMHDVELVLHVVHGYFDELGLVAALDMSGQYTHTTVHAHASS